MAFLSYYNKVHDFEDKSSETIHMNGIIYLKEHHKNGQQKRLSDRLSKFVSKSLKLIINYVGSFGKRKIDPKPIAKPISNGWFLFRFLN